MNIELFVKRFFLRNVSNTALEKQPVIFFAIYHCCSLHDETILLARCVDFHNFFPPLLISLALIIAVGKVMAKEEAAGPGGAVAAAAVAAMEKHIAMHSIYAIPPSAGAMPPSPQTQRPGGLKHSSSREEAAQEEQDYLSTPHSKYFFSKNLFHRR